MSDKIIFSMPKPKKTAVFSMEEKPKSNWGKNKSPIYQKLIGSKMWHEIRDLHLSEFPLCVFCDHPAVNVHHINSKDFDLFYERSNHASICEACHKKVNEAYHRGIDPGILFKKKEILCQA